MTVHLTLCGLYAGRPLCDCDREKASERGDTFLHAIYAPNAAFRAKETCPDCIDAWNSVDDLEDLVTATTEETSLKLDL